MKLDRFLRLTVALLIVLVFVIAIAALLFVTESALNVWDRLLQGPRILLYAYIGVMVGLVVTAVWMDPEPVTYLEFIELACAVMGKRKPLVKLPAPLMRPAGRLPGFERLTGVPREAFEHSFYAVEYDMANVTPALAKHGISCPPVASYIDVMVEYYLKHADDPRIRRGDWKQVTT